MFPAKDYITGDKFSIHKCSGCGCVFTQFEPCDFGKYYQGPYYGRRKSFVERLINYSRLRKVSGLSGNKINLSVLDIGCGNGSFLSLLSKKGWEVSGTETAPESHFISDGISARICKKDLIKCKFPDNKFDIITMWHTLEHFAGPKVYLSEAKRSLKSGGFLIAEIPNFGSFQSCLTRHNWFHLDVPRHLVHYDPKTVSSLLNSTGFSVLKISHFSFIYGLFGFIQSIINVFTTRKNLLFDLLNGKLKFSRHILKDLLITFGVIVPVSLAGVPIVFLESSLKRGGVITVYASKS
ncbi:MAG: class I SAM-dependent methyltransferase [bacterium]